MIHILARFTSHNGELHIITVPHTRGWSEYGEEYKRKLLGRHGLERRKIKYQSTYADVDGGDYMTSLYDWSI